MKNLRERYLSLKPKWKNDVWWCCNVARTRPSEAQKEWKCGLQHQYIDCMYVWKSQRGRVWWRGGGEICFNVEGVCEGKESRCMYAKLLVPQPLLYYGGLCRERWSGQQKNYLVWLQSRIRKRKEKKKKGHSRSLTFANNHDNLLPTTLTAARWRVSQCSSPWPCKLPANRWCLLLLLLLLHPLTHLPACTGRQKKTSKVAAKKK